MDTARKDTEKAKERRIIGQISRLLYEEHQITMEEQLRIMELLRKG